MMWVMFQPRQFHLMVIENSNEEHIKGAMWLFPVYTFLITLFVMPIPLGGIIIHGGNTAQADYFVLNLPMQAGHSWLAMLVFIGGFSASAGLVMIESVVLSTMVLNHLIRSYLPPATDPFWPMVPVIQLIVAVSVEEHHTLAAQSADSTRSIFCFTNRASSSISGLPISDSAATGSMTMTTLFASSPS